MAQNIKKSAKDMVKAALSTVPAISVEDALGLVDNDTHVFVDLRDGTEQSKTGTIPGAVASSRGMMEFHIDPESPAHKPAFNQDKTVPLPVFCSPTQVRSSINTPPRCARHGNKGVKKWRCLPAPNKRLASDCI